MPMAELASPPVDRIISEVDGASDDRGEVLATTLVWGGEPLGLSVSAGAGPLRVRGSRAG